jgi:hypothetical protein
MTIVSTGIATDLPQTTESSTAEILPFPTPNGKLREPFGLVGTTAVTIPSSAATIPAAANGNGVAQPQEANGHDRPAPIGHNSGESAPMADEDGGTKARAIAEIQAGLRSRLGPTFEFMTAAEIGAAPNRGILLKRAHADGLAYLHRALDALDPEPDDRQKRFGSTLVPYVFSYECLFSDNPDGCSTVTNKRLAALLGASERAIRYARHLLVELRATICRAIPGIGNAYHPVFNRKLVGASIQVTWWLDSTSEPLRWGRPSQKTPAASLQTPAARLPVFEKTPADSRKTPAAPFDQPIENKRNAGRESTKESTRRKGADAPPAAKERDARKGMRLPEDWVLPERWRAHPRQRGLSEAQIDAMAREFRRHWLSATGQKASKLRWDLTWETWVDNSIDKYGLRPAGKPSSTAESDIDAEVQRRLDADIGRLMVGTIGRAKAMEELRKQVQRERGGAND